MRAEQLYILIPSGDSTKLCFSNFPDDKNHPEGTLKKKKDDQAPNLQPIRPTKSESLGNEAQEFSFLTESPGNQVTYAD